MTEPESMSEPPVTTVVRQARVVIVRTLVEKFNDDAMRRFYDDVRAAADSHSRLPFVVDVTKVGFMPSLSLGLLVRLATEFRSRNQRFILAGLQPQVREVFVLTRLDRLFELQDDVPTAVRTLEST
ncbi:MAG: STAS domain-containing protein [Planctomycetes bacterium]|nr:STAS domain-containing protein [Planctomycetota bacterium]